MDRFMSRSFRSRGPIAPCSHHAATAAAWRRDLGRKAAGTLVEGGEDFPQRRDHLRDLLFLDDQGRRDRDDVAGLPDEDALLEAAQEDLEAERAGGARPRPAHNRANTPQAD